VGSHTESVQDREPVLSDPPDHPVAGLAALVQHGELVRAQPAELRVLARLEPRPGQVAVDPDQEVGFVPVQRRVLCATPSVRQNRATAFASLADSLRNP